MHQIKERINHNPIKHQENTQIEEGTTYYHIQMLSQDYDDNEEE